MGRTNPIIGLHGNRCTAHTGPGVQCKRFATRGAGVCSTHGGAAPQVRAKALRRLAAMVDPALEVLYLALRDRKKQPALAFAAARDVLDRTGFKPGDKLEIAGVGDTVLQVVFVTPEQVRQPAVTVELLAGEDKT